jgi:hypothetical protein
MRARLILGSVATLLAMSCAPASSGRRSSSDASSSSTGSDGTDNETTVTGDSDDTGATGGDTGTTGEDTGDTSDTGDSGDVGEDTGDTGDTGGGGGLGLCNNEADSAVIDIGMVESAGFECGVGCLGQDGSCVSQCMTESSGLTPGCAACFSPVIECLLQACAGPCGADPAGAECTLCQVQNGCLDGFDDCALGDPGTEATGMDTGGSGDTGFDTGDTGGTGFDTGDTGFDTGDSGDTGFDTGDTGGSGDTGGGGGLLVDGQICPGVLGYEGCCQNNQLYWCETDGKVHSVDCMQNPSCGWKAEVSYYDCGTNGGNEPAGMFPINCPPAAE